MFTKEMFDFLIKVITSWQVIVVTICLIIYISLVSHVARLYHPQRSRFSFDSKPEKEKPAAVDMPESGDDDDLGIED